MERDINQFIKELREYINTYIVGTETTVIEGCPEETVITNRGHAIRVRIKKSDDIDKDTEEISPMFYVEELLKSYPKNTVAMIAEVINAKVIRHYQEWMWVTKIQQEAMKKSIDDFGDNIIVSALPSSALNDPKAKDPFIIEERPELGVTKIMKGMLCDAKDFENSSYFTSIAKKDDRPVTNEDWEKAEATSLRTACIQAGCIPVVLEDGTFIPVCGQITDVRQFYDYFYLLSPEQVWSGLADKFDVDRIYILPINAHAAHFIIESQAVRDHDEAKSLRSIFLESAVDGAPPLPEGIAKAYVLDCATMQVTKFREESLPNG